jgi:ABC-type transport system involved in multi-copper enzyme maturation permease subunit
MLSQTSAFLTRSIRQESRLLSHHMMRGGMVVTMLYLLFLQVVETARFGAAGLTLIGNVIQCCYWCLTLLGVMYFAVAITEEKEEETLPLLRMTGVRDVTLLLGKSLPRLAVVILLILIAAPFLMLAVTLGGVVREQIFSSLLGLICYAFFLSQAGLFCSTVARNNSRAVTATFLVWLTLEFGHVLPFLISLGCHEWGLPGLSDDLAWLSGNWRERTMWQTSGTYLMFERGDAIWHSQMTFHLIVGSLFFAVSHQLFEHFNAAAIAQGAVATVATGRGALSQTRKLPPRRSWPDALEWKSWQFAGGGLLWFIVWLILLPVLSVSVILFISIAIDDMAPAEAYAGTMMFVGVGGLVLAMGRVYGFLFNKEIFEQTLTSLCMLPISRARLLRRMAVGVLPFAIPGVVCFTLGFFWMLAVEPRFDEDTAELLVEPWFWASLSWAVVTLHVGVLFSIWFRHGGMLVAFVVCCIIFPSMGGMFVATLAMVFRGVGGAMEDFFQYVVPCFLMPVHFVVCFILQRMILNRVEELAAK